MTWCPCDTNLKSPWWCPMATYSYWKARWTLAGWRRTSDDNGERILVRHGGSQMKRVGLLRWWLRR